MSYPSNMNSSSRGCKKTALVILVVLAGISGCLGLIILLVALTGSMHPVIGLITAFIFILPILVILIMNLQKQRRKNGHFDGKAWWMLAVVIILGIILLVSLVFVIVNLGGCQGRLGPDASLTGCDLSGQDLSGRNLSNATIRYADLNQVDFSNADLSGVDFTGSNLHNADFTDANLANVIFDMAKLINVIGLTDEMLADSIHISVEDLYAVTAQKQIQLEERSLLLAELKIACQSQAVPSAHRYDVDQPFHTLVIFDDDGENIDLTSTTILRKWEPMAVRFTDLVACVGEEQEEIVQTCHYNDGIPIVRYAYWQEIEVIQARTGQILSSTVLHGKQPDYCPDYAPESQDKIRGGGVTHDQITEYLEEFISSGEE